MAFDEAFTWRYVGPAIAYLGALPVSQDSGVNLRAMKQALKALRDGAALVVFPEGAREFADGEMLPFKEGVARLAAQARVLTLPVTISGGNHVWPQKQKYPRFFHRVTITYHPLIAPPELGSKDEDTVIDAWNEKLRDIIASAM